MYKEYVGGYHGKPKSIWEMLTFDKTTEKIDYSLFIRAGKFKDELINLIENENEKFSAELLILSINDAKKDFINLINICFDIKCVCDKISDTTNDSSYIENYDFDSLKNKMFELENSCFKYNNYMFSFGFHNFQLMPAYHSFLMNNAGIPSSNNKFELISLLHEYFNNKKQYYINSINHFYNDIDAAEKKLGKNFSDFSNEYYFLNKEFSEIFCKIDGTLEMIDSLKKDSMKHNEGLEEIIKINPSCIYLVLEKLVDYLES